MRKPFLTGGERAIARELAAIRARNRARIVGAILMAVPWSVPLALLVMAAAVKPAPAADIGAMRADRAELAQLARDYGPRPRPPVCH